MKEERAYYLKCRICKIELDMILVLSPKEAYKMLGRLDDLKKKYLKTKYICKYHKKI